MVEEHGFKPGDRVTGDSCTDITGPCTGTYIRPHIINPKYTEIADDRWDADSPHGGNSSFVYTNSLRPAAPRVLAAASPSYQDQLAEVRAERDEALADLSKAEKQAQDWRSRVQGRQSLLESARIAHAGTQAELARLREQEMLGVRNRDDLTKLLKGIEAWGYASDPAACANTILAAGFLHSVTAKQLEEAAEAAYISDNRTSPWSIKPWSELHEDIRSGYRVAARVVITTVGLSIDGVEGDAG
jgi:multidrug efflux pump subunit AcrA (membrane-fusion protein)